MIDIKKHFIGEPEWVSSKNGEFKLILLDELNNRAFYMRKIHQFEGKGKDRHILYTTVMLEIVRYSEKTNNYPCAGDFGHRGYCIPLLRLNALTDYYKQKYNIPDEVIEVM